MHWLGFTGDVMLGRLVDERQRERPPAALWGDMLERLQALDGLFVNLECCLSTRGTPWTRTHRPFHFRGDPSVGVPALETAGVDYASLANNHCMDYGAVALEDTLDALDDAGIAHAGAGRDRAAAEAPAVVSAGDCEVAVVSVTDNTPEYAADDGPGVAHAKFDPDRTDHRERVAAALDRAREHDPDLLVASLHWGPNMVVEPPERHERFGRWLCEQGVDLVHGHSAHVVQGIERTAEGTICYDCGDFVDDYAVNEGLRNDLSFLFVLGVEGGEPVRLELHPTRIDDCAVHAATDGAADRVRRIVRERSSDYGTDFRREGEALVVDL